MLRAGSVESSAVSPRHPSVGQTYWALWVEARLRLWVAEKCSGRLGFWGLFPEISPWSRMFRESFQRMGYGLGYWGAFLEDG